MIYENETARLLYEEVRNFYNGILEGTRLTEDMALAMYYHALGSCIPVINEVIHVPVYNIEVY